MSSIPVTVFSKKTGPSSTPSISSGTTHIACPASWNLCLRRASAPATEKNGWCGQPKNSFPREELKKIFPAFYWVRYVRAGPPRRVCPILRHKLHLATTLSAAPSPEASFGWDVSIPDGGATSPNHGNAAELVPTNALASPNVRMVGGYQAVEATSAPDAQKRRPNASMTMARALWWYLWILRSRDLSRI
jgi:hypothetical protein